MLSVQGLNLRVRQCHFVPFVSLKIASGDSEPFGDSLETQTVPAS